MTFNPSFQWYTTDTVKLLWMWLNRPENAAALREHNEWLDEMEACFKGESDDTQT